MLQEQIPVIQDRQELQTKTKQGAATNVAPYIKTKTAIMKLIQYIFMMFVIAGMISCNDAESTNETQPSDAGTALGRQSAVKDEKTKK